eukprot:1311043-Lingulodinium_polyedra.AAC.1
MADSGMHGEELEYEITFLKGCKLFAAIGSRPIARSLVLEVLGILNEEALESLSASYPIAERRVVNPAKA